MNIKHNRFWIGLGIGIVAISALGLIWLQTPDNITRLLHSPVPLPPEFMTSRVLWNEQNLTNYHMTVRLAWGDMVSANLTFTVQNNQPIKAEIRPFGGIVSPVTTPDWYTKRLNKIFLPAIEDYTIDQLFDFAAAKLQSQPSSDTETAHYTVTFDKEKGYVNSLTYDAYDECTIYNESGTPIFCHATYYLWIMDLQPLGS